MSWTEDVRAELEALERGPRARRRERWPAPLRRAHRAWMAAGLAMGWVVSRVVLTAIFGLVLVPVALVARVAGKRFLSEGRDPAAATYWTPLDAGRAVDHTKPY